MVTEKKVENEVHEEGQYNKASQVFPVDPRCTNPPFH